MTPRSKLYMAGTALLISGAAFLYVRRQHALQTALAAAPGIAPPDMFAPDLSDFPAGTAVTWFQGQMTPGVAQIPDQTTGSLTEYLPLFGFLRFGGMGVPDGFAA